MNASAPLTGKPDFSLMCEAALQNSEMVISDLAETTGRKLAPRSICLSLIFVVVSHGGTIGQGSLVDLRSLLCCEQEAAVEDPRGTLQPGFFCGSVTPSQFSSSSHCFYVRVSYCLMLPFRAAQ